MPVRILGVDPGSAISGVVIKDGEEITFAAGKLENEKIFDLFALADALVIELFVLHGGGGNECRDTLLFTGRLWQAWKAAKGQDPVFLTRIKVTSVLGLNTKEAKQKPGSMDSKVTKLMSELYGDKAKAAKVTYHAWQALGLVTAFERVIAENARSRSRSGSKSANAATDGRTEPPRNFKGVVRRGLYRLASQADLRGRSRKPQKRFARGPDEGAFGTAGRTRSRRV